MASPRQLRAALHGFGLERGRLTTAIAQSAGVPANDLAALEHLELAGPLSPTDLAKRLLLTPGSVTALLDRLERAGWVRRRPHATSRRSIVVELSPAARSAAAAAGLEDYDAAVERAARRLTPSEREAAARFLAAVSAAAADHTAGLVRAPLTGERAEI
jgi:DNA-binding MarR family transcriptional regulator